MARIMDFKEGDVLIRQGEEGQIAYLIQSGWVEVRRKSRNGSITTTTVGPGEIVGELGLAGLTPKRSASVIALTDGQMEVIDRGALIRLVNSPGRELMPLLSALLHRLKHALLDAHEADDLDDTVVIYARIEGLNKRSRQALCNRPCLVTRLPWFFGAYRPPQSVTDLFREHSQADIKLSDPMHLLRERHLAIEAADSGGLQLHLMQHGDHCELDDERIGYGRRGLIVPMPPGRHTLKFGDISDPYAFAVHVHV